MKRIPVPRNRAGFAKQARSVAGVLWRKLYECRAACCRRWEAGTLYAELYRTPPYAAEVTPTRGIAAPATTTGLNGASARAAGRLRSAAATVAQWIESAAARYAEAALYTQLSRLSDAALHRRGIARGDLHPMVSDAAKRR
jgi:hypothetical protein